MLNEKLFQQLDQKKDNYLQLVAESSLDSNGFIEYSKCDSLLFSCLLGATCMLPFDPTAARDQNHGWHRRPLSYGECYPQHSKSTISRDMLLGLAFYCRFAERDDIALDVIRYAIKHLGVMGKGVLSRTMMSPSLLGTFALIVKEIQGDEAPLFIKVLSKIPLLTPNIKKLADYEKHLFALHYYLRRRSGDSFSSDHFIAVEDLYRTHQSNPLFAILTANYNIAAHIMMSEYLWPADRLPNSEDRKTEWVPMRNAIRDLTPEDGPVKAHSGGDFLFLYWLLRDHMSSNVIFEIMSNRYGYNASL